MALRRTGLVRQFANAFESPIYQKQYVGASSRLLSVRPLQASIELSVLLSYKEENEKNKLCGSPGFYYGTDSLYLFALRSSPNLMLQRKSTTMVRQQLRNFTSTSSLFIEKPQSLPKAEDCDAALAHHADIKSRLDRLQRPSSIRTWDQMAKDLIKTIYTALVATIKFTISFPGRIQDFRKMPKDEWKSKRSAMWAAIKHEAHHYWVGTKLLAYEVRIATGYAIKAAKGDTLTRRERRQLTRTTADLFRLVPMIVIVVIPFLELSLPVLLRLFPNMLPSTYEDKPKKEEELRRRLNIKLELAKFLQDTVAEMAKDIKARSTGEKAQFAAGLGEFLNKVRAGQPVDNHEIIRFAQLFNDDLTLDNLERVQLVSMCQFVGISPFGTDQFLRSRLRQHLQKMKRDDYEIEQEGLENLTSEELRAACRARGMRAPFGEGAVPFMRRNLRDWLDLSLHRGLPSSLLLLSRAFTITASDVITKKEIAYSKLKDTLGVLSGEVVETVELATSTQSDAASLSKKLEYLKREEEIIRQEAAASKVKKVVVADATAAPAAPAAAPAEKETQAISEEEKLALLQVEREQRVKALAVGLINLVSGGGVARERQLFMDLVTKEVDSINKALAKQAAVRSFLFSSKGLEVTDRAAQDAQEEAGAARVSARVTKLLKSIEKELDTAEHQIGNKMHVLDVDNDGVVTRDELERALSFIRAQLDPDDMHLLYTLLGAAAARQPEASASDSIAVSNLLAIAKGTDPHSQPAAALEKVQIHIK